jgi:predicted O-methyltransferase YrrM
MREKTKKKRLSSKLRFLDTAREKTAVGPIQREEALALFGIVRCVRPRVIVEFGFCEGFSARVFLNASPKAKVFSYDPDERRFRLGWNLEQNHSRFTFFPRPMQSFRPEDIGDEIDFVFFDAAHDEKHNQDTFRLIEPHLSSNAIVSIHDTGTWALPHMNEEQRRVASGGEMWRDDEYVHQPGEWRFLNWLMENRPQWRQFHLHSTNCLRHGLTFLQRYTL